VQVKAACELWDGTGALVFTSSAGIYTATSGDCDEDSEVAAMGASERINRLLGAEDAVLAAGGNVVRLVGLYHGHRGAHTFFLRQGTVERNEQNVVNLIHYEDAALLVMSVRHHLPKPGMKHACGYQPPASADTVPDQSRYVAGATGRR
jgi:hypothetical protein